MSTIRVTEPYSGHVLTCYTSDCGGTFVLTGTDQADVDRALLHRRMKTPCTLVTDGRTYTWADGDEGKAAVMMRALGGFGLVETDPGGLIAAGHDVTGEARDSTGRWALSPGGTEADPRGDTGAASDFLFTTIPANAREQLIAAGMKNMRSTYGTPVVSANVTDSPLAKRGRAMMSANVQVKHDNVVAISAAIWKRAQKDKPLREYLRHQWQDGFMLEYAIRRVNGNGTMQHDAGGELSDTDKVAARMYKWMDDDGAEAMEKGRLSTWKPWEALMNTPYFSDAQKSRVMCDYITDRYIAAWAGNATDETESRIVQNAVAEHFGIENPLMELQSNRGRGMTEEYEMTKPFADAFVEATYERTQAVLSQAGITELHIARGMSWEQDEDEWWDKVPPAIVKMLSIGKAGGPLKLKQNPLSSWSTEGRVAEEFSSDCTRGVQARIGMVVPASDIFSLTTTGLGCLSESEVVVIGNPGHVGLGVAMDTSVPKGYDDDDD